jgi:hypothetical protein
MLATLRTTLVATLALGAAAPALAQVDRDLPLSTALTGDIPAGAPPWANVRFRDFTGIPDSGIYNWIEKTVEVQVTTGQGCFDLLDDGSCRVEGLGNLTGDENLKALWLNVSPHIDPSKLKVYWTGESMPPGTVGDACDDTGCADTFPQPGLRPTDMAIGRNRFRAGPSGCLFDILIQWRGGSKLGQEAEHSKLLLVYDDANTEIDSSDFILPSDACRNSGALFIGVGHIQNTDGPEGSGWIKDGPPAEPPPPPPNT